MSFFNMLAKAASSTIKAANEAHNNLIVDTWNVYKRKNNDFLEQLIVSPDISTDKRIIAIAACHQNGYWGITSSLDTYYSRCEGGKYDNQPALKSSIDRLSRRTLEIDSPDALELHQALEGVKRQYF